MAGPARLPPKARTVVGNEACERFAFQGLRSILVTYMVTALLYSERDARVYFHGFVAAVSFAHLVGAWFADRFLGRRRTILWVSLLYVLGSAVLALLETRDGLLAGLSLVALGAGGMKPCVSAFVGDRLGAGETTPRRLHGRLPWSIGLGSAAACLLVPWLLGQVGPRAAFAVPGVAMGAALLVLSAGRWHAVRAPPAGPRKHGFLRVVLDALRGLGTVRPGEHWLDAARERHLAEAVEGAKAVFRISGVFAAVTLFWALFDQKSSSWVLQGRLLDGFLGSTTIAAEQLQAANPLLLMALVPLLDRVVLPFLERRGVVLSAPARMTAGMFATAASFAAAALVQTLVDQGRSPSILWQLPQYVLLTAGEALVSVTGLVFAHAQAPRSMRRTITSLWLLTVVLGNLLTAVVTKLMPLEGAACFWLFGAFMLGAAFAFRLVAGGYREVQAPGERGVARAQAE